MSFQQSSGSYSNNNSASNVDNFDRQSINSGSGSIATLNDEFSSTLSSLSNSSYQHQTQLTSSASTDFIRLQQQEKIVQDYVKLRNKLTILKNAYKELSETCVQKDQSIRKYEQEIESLNFRNQQLTSRVENLQKELLEANVAHSASSNGYIASGSSGNQLHIPSQSTSSSPVSTNNLAFSSSTSSSSATNSSSQGSNYFSNSLSSSTKMQRNNSNVSNSSSSKLDVMGEELQHKINENVALNRRLNEIEVEFRQKLAKSEQLLKQIEGEKMVVDRKLESNESSSKILIEKLQNDKIKLELHVIQLENQLRTIYQEEKTANVDSANNSVTNGAHGVEIKQKASNSDQLEADATKAVETLETSVLADMFHTQVDCLSKIYVCLDEIADNVKPRKQQHSKLALKCEQLLKQQLVPLIVSQSAKSRPNSPAPSSTSSNQQQQQQLKSDFDRLLNEFFDSNHLLIQSIVTEISGSSSQPPNEAQGGMDIINKKLKIYLNKLDTLLFVNGSQGSSTSSLNSTQNSSGHSSPVSKDAVAAKDTSSFVSQIAKLLHILLFSKSSQMQQVVQLFNSNGFQRGLSLFVDILEKLLFVYNEKLSLEYTSECSTVILTNDECIVSYLTQLKQTLNQFASLLETGSSSSLNDAVSKLVSQVNMLTTSDDEGQNGLKGVDLEEEIEKLRQKLSEKEKELNELQEKYEQLKSKALNDVQDMERLKSKLEQMQNQFLKQKQDNQTLVKELDELKLKNQQQQQQNDDLIKQQIELQSISKSNSDHSLGFQKAEPPEFIAQMPKEKSVSPPPDFVSVVQEPPAVIQQTPSAHLVEDPTERLTIDFCLAKIDELNQQIKVLDGKALFYYEEMSGVLERLKMQIQENVKQENELIEVKDQLERTRNTYEMQMSTMSDHLITVNESLTKHAEENERLKHELMSRNSSSATNNISSSTTPLLSATGSSSNSSKSSNSKSKKAK